MKQQASEPIRRVENELQKNRQKLKKQEKRTSGYRKMRKNSDKKGSY